MWIAFGLVGLAVGLVAGLLWYTHAKAEVVIMAIIGCPLSAWLLKDGTAAIGLSENDVFAGFIGAVSGAFIGIVATGN